MALPGSGQLSFSAIASELGAGTPYSLRSMSNTAGLSTPDSVSEFYGYSSSTITYTLLGTWYANDPCYYDTANIYLGSDNIYYAYYNSQLYTMSYVTLTWYEFMYYDSNFGFNVYTQWEIDSFNMTLTDQGLVFSYC